MSLQRILVILYARFSPRKDADRCKAIWRQLAEMRQHCADQGYQIEGAFWDWAESGADEDRDGFLMAVDAMRNGYVLIATAGDRLARNVDLKRWLRWEGHRHGWRIETVDGRENGDDPIDDLLRGVLELFAEYERKLNSIRTRKGMRYLVAHGRKVSRHAQYGYRLDSESPTGLTADPAQQAGKDRMILLYREGNSFRAIARALTAEGFPTANGAAAHSHTVVKRVLERAKVIR